MRVYLRRRYHGETVWHVSLERKRDSPVSVGTFQLHAGVLRLELYW